MEWLWLWLEAAINQAPRLIAANLAVRAAASRGEPFDAPMRREIAEANFFLIALNNALRWAEETRAVAGESTQAAIDNFVAIVGVAKQLRDMREHADEYLRGEGKHPDRFTVLFDFGGKDRKIPVDATAAVTLFMEYHLGGRLEVSTAVEASQALLDDLKKGVG